MSEYKLDEQVWVRCTIRYEQTHKYQGDERYWVGRDNWVGGDGSENNQPVLPADIRTLEELTSEAVKAERERIVAEVSDWYDHVSEPDAVGASFRVAFMRVIEFLDPLKPTPKEVLGHILEDDDQAEEVLAALATYADSLDLVNQTFVGAKVVES